MKFLKHTPNTVFAMAPDKGCGCPPECSCKCTTDSSCGCECC